MSTVMLHYVEPPPGNPLDAAIFHLKDQYRVEGELELYFIRQIAGYQLTVESLQRNIDRLLAATEIDDTRVDRLSRAQQRTQRMELAALKELKDLQSRRNLTERFPDQTKDCPPLADHFCHIGESPIVRPFSPVLRGRLYPPTDHSLVRVTKPGEAPLPKLVPDDTPAEERPWFTAGIP